MQERLFLARVAIGDRTAEGLDERFARVFAWFAVEEPATPAFAFVALRIVTTCAACSATAHRSDSPRNRNPLSCIEHRAPNDS